MKVDFEFGVCVSNEDPKNGSRIRAIPVSQLTRFANTVQIKKYISESDQTSIASGTYNPWDVSNNDFNNPDPFLCEPMLPKHLTILPRFGQLVRIIKYDTIGVQNEYLGPYTIDQINLGEEFKNVLRRLDYSYNTNEVTPKKSKTTFSGYNNEQVILGDNEVIVRLDHINDDFSKKTQYPFMQLVKYNDSYNTQKTIQNTTTQVDFFVDYICELDITYTPKKSVNENNIVGTLVLYNTKDVKTLNNKFGLTKTFYNKSEQYYQNEYVVKHTIKTNNITTLRNKVNEILVLYELKKTINFFEKTNSNTIQTFSINNIEITTDNRYTGNINSGNAINDDIVIPDLNTWLFRINPNTQIENYEGQFNYPNLPVTDLNYIRVKDYNDLSVYISECKAEKRYGKFLVTNTKQTQTEVVEYKSKNTEESAAIYYADKLLFLSSLNSPNIITNKFYDGIPLDEFTRIFKPIVGTTKTYGMLRGETTLNLIIRVLEAFMSHGHVDGVPKEGSLIENSKITIAELIRDLKNDINNTQNPSQNTLTINHNFRIN